MAKLGRKSGYEEFKDGTLLGMTTSWLIANWYGFTKEEKMKVALIIAPKGITDKVQHTGVIDVAMIEEMNGLFQQFRRSQKQLVKA
jgi:hypothetical protein